MTDVLMPAKLTKFDIKWDDILLYRGTNTAAHQIAASLKRHAVKFQSIIVLSDGESLGVLDDETLKGLGLRRILP